MILTIPGGAQQVWGSAVWLNVTEATNPEGLALFKVVFRVIGASGNLLVETSLIPGRDAPAGECSLNIAPYLTAPEVVTVLWGYSYTDLATNVVNYQWSIDERNISLVNETEVTMGGTTIPGGSVQLSGNPIEIGVTSSAGAVGDKTNYRIALKITCDALMGSPYVEEIAPDKDFKAVFDISGFVDQPMDYTFDYPVKGALGPYDARVFHVTIDSGEVYLDAEGERVVNWNGDLQGHEIRVIKGMLRPYELGLLNDIGKSFYTEYIQGGKFLTHQPNFQKVAPNHVPRLWYLSRWEENHPFQAHLKINTADKVAHLPVTQDFVFWDITGLVDFAFQPEFWGRYYSNVESYEFWLSDASGDISEHRTYLIDRKYYEKSFTLYYFNPLGGLDLLWLTGEHTEGMTTEAEVAYRPVPFGSGSKVGSLSTISARGQRTWEINTGTKTREQLLAMRDFLEAKYRWMVDPDNNDRVIPVVIEAGDYSLYDSMKINQDFEVKIMEAH